jgi:hypothetical protein
MGSSSGLWGLGMKSWALDQTSGLGRLFCFVYLCEGVLAPRTQQVRPNSHASRRSHKNRIEVALGE